MNQSNGHYQLISRLISRSLCLAAALFLLSCAQAPSKDETSADSFTIKVLGMNDFHGQVLPKDSEGGMYNFSAHVLQAIESSPHHAFLVHAGDHVGASPAESALLQDEPSISFLNMISDYCATFRNKTCHVLGTAGNHEFDEGTSEMMRLLQGGNHLKGPFLEPQWQGANYKTLSANVVDKASGELLLPPYVVHEVNGVNIGFIGLTLDYTPELVVPGTVDDLVFENQADVAKRYVKQLQEQGINAIVIVVHDGTRDEYYSGFTKPSVGIDKTSKFGQFLAELPGAVDLVVTGHSHRFTNAYFTRNDGSQLLVTQSFSSGRAYADITLTIDKRSKDVSHAVAKVILANDAPTDSLSGGAKETLGKLNNLINDSVEYAQTYTQAPVNIYQPSANDIPLGQFIANSHQFNMQTDLAIMNSGGVRAGLKAGQLTWGDLFSIQPFGNQLVVREYSGEQLLGLINERHHWSSDVNIAENGDVSWRGQALDPTRKYTVAGNNYIMNGEVFSVGEQVRLGGYDVDATVDYIKRLKTPFNLLDKPLAQ